MDILDNKFDRIISRCIMLFCFVVVILCLIIGTVGEKEKWNNGYCPDCDRKWEFSERVDHWSQDGNHITYIYKCPKCGKTIELNQLR